MSQMIEEERLPYIEFEKRYIPVNVAPGEEAKGHIEQDIILITPLGSRDRLEKPVVSHLAQMRQQVAEKRIPKKFYDQVSGAYELWKKGENFGFGGTPIELLGLSKDQLVMLKGFKIHSIEDLAGANEDLLAMIGMGGRGLMMKAKAFMENKPKADLTNELTSLRVNQERQEDQIGKLTVENAEASEDAGCAE